MSEASGWGIVPPTILRDGPFGEGMVQAFVEADPDVDVVAMVVEDDPRLRRMAVLDAVDEQHRPQGRPHPAGRRRPARPRRRSRRLLLAGAQAPDGAVGLARDSRSQPDEVDGLERIRDALDGDLGAALRDAAVADRGPGHDAAGLDGLLASGRFPYPSPDWPAIPWPPF